MIYGFNSSLPSTFALPFILSGSALKFIAVIAMLIDHCALYFINPNLEIYTFMRTVGRIAFPVFAFLIAEGAAYTRNRYRYLLTLLLFAFISEIPWIFLWGDNTHNVLFTLSLGVIGIYLFDRLCEHKPLCCFSIILICVFAYFLNADYDWRGVLIIILFYILRQKTAIPWLPDSKVNLSIQKILQLLFVFPFLILEGVTGTLLASLLLISYDGTRGQIKGAVAKYSFYAFYPVHLLLFSYILNV